jgi:hypothetical protein
MAVDRGCPFYKARFNAAELTKLQQEKLKRVRDTRSTQSERSGPPHTAWPERNTL